MSKNQLSHFNLNKPCAIAALALLGINTGLSAEVQTTSSSNAAPETLGQKVDDLMVLWQGDGEDHLRITAKLQGGYYNQDKSWFGNSKDALGEKSDYWWEGAFTPGLEGVYTVGDGQFYGRVSGVYATTSSDIDAAGSNANGQRESSMRLEDAYLGWRSGDTFSFGKDFIDVSFGRQQYVAGNGFLFYSQSSNGKNRGGYWLGERRAADFLGKVTFNTGKLKTDLIYLNADDNPNTNTKLGGVTLDYQDEKWGYLGGGYYHLNSNTDLRQGMDVYDIRGQYKPFKVLDAPEWIQPLTFEGEYVYEKNGSALEAHGWYASVGYEFADVAMQPSLTYRYAAFSGDEAGSSKNEGFDPLFYGFNDWGQWYQGEIMGEYVLSNSNLNTHAFILKTQPTDTITARVIYYIFQLDEKETFGENGGVDDDDLASEVNFIVDWSPTDRLSFSFVLAAADPDDASKQEYGGNDTWLYGMAWASIEF